MKVNEIMDKDVHRPALCVLIIHKIFKIFRNSDFWTYTPVLATQD